MRQSHYDERAKNARTSSASRFVMDSPHQLGLFLHQGNLSTGQRAERTDPGYYSLAHPQSMYLTDAFTNQTNDMSSLPDHYNQIDAHGTHTTHSISPGPRYAMLFNARDKEESTTETRDTSQTQGIFAPMPMSADPFMKSFWKDSDVIIQPNLYSGFEPTSLAGTDKFHVNWDDSSPIAISRPPSNLKIASPRTRTRTTPRNQHHQYLDSILRAKCPKDLKLALDVAIQFRNEHNPAEPIPNDLLDELLQQTDGDKYYCFCCPKARKARTITPARDHVRKSLGNFPFQCPNPWCQHSSLRQADLNKHIKTCSTALSHGP